MIAGWRPHGPGYIDAPQPSGILTMTILNKTSAAPAGRGETGNIAPVGGLLRAWAECQRELDEVNLRYEKAFANQTDDPSPLYALAARQDELKTRSGDLLSQLIGVPSRDLADVRTKLQVWRSVACPPGTKLNAANTADHVAVSALMDLERLLEG